MDDKQLLEAIRGIVQEETGKLDKKIDEVDTGLRAVIENSMDDISKLLKEDYGRVAMGVAETKDYPQVRATVQEHGEALQQHNERLEALEQKAI